jgi:hypothetical protein
MSSNSEDAQNQALSKALAAWQVRTSLSPGFQESVWRRIDRAASSSAPGLLKLVGQFARSVVRPGWAVSSVLALLCVGLAAGYFEGQAANQQIRQELSRRYLQVVDPYQAQQP